MTFVCLSAVAAAADPAHGQSVDAEALYQRGRELLKRGDTAAACQALADSLRLEQAIGTALNLADCREREGKLASAWELFLRVASLATRAGARPQADEARRRADRLAPRLSYLTIAVAEASRIDGLAITRDGAPVDPSLWNHGVPVDGGRHVIAASAPGAEAVSLEVELAASGGKASVEVPKLARRAEPMRRELAAAPAPAASGPAPRATGRPVREPAAPAAARRMTGARWIAVATGGAGVIALGAGGHYGNQAREGEREARRLCPVDPCNDGTALAIGDQAVARARRANLAFAAGGALLAGGVALWLLGGPADRKPRVAVVPVIERTGGGLAVRGGW